MADFSKGKQPLKSHPLRNELQLDSTDDEGASKSVVQVVRSDVVPETQLEEHNDCNQDHDQGFEYGEVPSSPSASSILEHNNVEKSMETSVPLSFGLVRPEPVSSLQTAAPFTFAPRSKVSNKTSSKQESVRVGQTDLIAGLSEGKAANDGSAIASPPNQLPRSSTIDVQQDILKSNSVETVNEKVSILSNGTETLCRASNEILVLTKSISGTPPSAQPESRSTNGNEKPRAGKIRGKVLRKGKKIGTSRQSGLPWPPRTKTSMSSLNQSPIPVPPIPDGAFSARKSEHSVARYDAGAHRIDGAVQTSKIIPDNYEALYDDSVRDKSAFRHLSVDQAHTKVSSRTATFGTSRNIPENRGFDLDADLSNVFLEQNLKLDSEHLPEILLEEPQMSEEQRLQASVHPIQLSQWQIEPSRISISQPSHTSPEPTHAGLSPQEAHPNPGTQVEILTEEFPNTMTQKWQHDTNHDGLNSCRELAHCHASADAAPRQVSGHSKPQRVTKAQKQIQSTDSPDSTISTLMTRGQGVLAGSDIDRCFESLKFALLEGQSHIQHEQMKEAKHLEDMRIVLQDKLDSQKETIAELKAKRQEQNAFIVRLTEKAKTNQKYAAGLQKDYEELQKLVCSFQRENKRTLQEKIAEIEREKESLRCMFEVATDASMKSQTNMKSMLEELYTRWIISESEKKGLAENLENQKSVYEDEKKKRDNLEKQLLSSVLAVQKQLGDAFIPLTGKLTQIQVSVDSFAADDKRDAGVKECLDALKQIQTAPFLTLKDVQKAERILRSMHDSVDSKLDVLSESMNGCYFPTQEMQTHFSNQLQDLRTEILKYEEVVTENRKVLQSNDSLQKELDAQQQYCLKLDAQVKVLQESEAGLKDVSAQLERELRDFKDPTRSQSSELLEMEREMTDLRHHLKRVEDNLVAANSKAEQEERLRKEQDHEAQKSKKRYEDCKAKLLEFDKKLKENKNEHTSELQERMAQEYRRIFEERESALKNEIHSLTTERDEQGEELRELNSEMISARVRLQKERKDVTALESELDDIRKEKMEVEVKLKDAQTISFRASELESLKEQLRRKSDDFQSKLQENEDLRSKLRDLQVSYDRLEVQASQHLSMIKTMRQEFDTQLCQERDKTQAGLLFAQDRSNIFQKEMDSLKSELAQSREDKTKWNKIQTTISSERDDLQRQVAVLRAEKEVSDKELLRVQAELSEKLEISEDTLRTQVDDLQRQLTLSHTALKGSEAKNRRQEVEHSQQLQSYKEIAEAKFKKLQKEQSLEPKEAGEHTAKTDCSQVFDSLATPSTPLHNTHAGKARQRINRENNAVIDIRDSSNPQCTVLERRSSTSRSQLPRSQRDGSTGLHSVNENSRDNFRPQETPDDYDLSVVDPCAEKVQETQENEGLPVPYGDFDEAFGPVAHKTPPSQHSSSTELSIIDSERMAQIEQEVGFDLPLTRGHERGVSKQCLVQAYAIETSVQSDSLSVEGSSSSFSQDRPRSRANTTSRIIPSRSRVPHHFEQHSNARDTMAKETTKYQPCEKVKHKTRNSNIRCLGSIPLQPAPEQINTHIDPRLLDRFNTGNDRLQASQDDSSQKRKSFSIETEKGASSKKRRVAAHPGSPQSPSPSVSYISGSSKTASRGKGLDSSSSAATSRASKRAPSSSKSNGSGRLLLSSNKSQTNTPTRRSSIRPKKSKGMEGRFSQELDTSR